ncbi:MAG TPA: class I SAM-dependent methyltransferase [Phototrophicaceae bacterium]|nr:class I SAM-dependent methyltransferase [Phototrophicaceae bacterium]
MEHSIRQRLNAINREFYRVTATEFDQTRQEAWRGWEPLLPYLSSITSVLDVGCGNGRFGVYLVQHLKAHLKYHGIDSNPALLNLAAVSLANDAPTLQVQLDEHDIIDNLPDTGQYDLVVLFGVMHHIPGYAERQGFIRKLAEQVTSGGVLAFACWRFYEFERFRERIIPWYETLRAEIETHDYLLDWRRGTTALRYCHYVDDNEHTELIRASGLTELSTYRADGFSGTVNHYSILRKM